MAVMHCVAQMLPCSTFEKKKRELRDGEPAYNLYGTVGSESRWDYYFTGIFTPA